MVAGDGLKWNETFERFPDRCNNEVNIFYIERKKFIAHEYCAILFSVAPLWIFI